LELLSAFFPRSHSQRATTTAERRRLKIRVMSSCGDVVVVVVVDYNDATDGA